MTGAVTGSGPDLHLLVEQVAAWIERDGLAGPDDRVLLAGSLAAGLGNVLSDIDVYFVRAHTARDLEGQQFFIADRRVDCHDVSLDDVARSTEALESVLAAHGAPSQNDLTFLYRVAAGLPVTRNPLDASVRRRCEQAVSAGVAATAARSIERAWSSLEAAVALRNADDHSIAARDLEEAALYGSLATHGSSYPNQKWNHEKARQLHTGTECEALAAELGALCHDAWPGLPDPVQLTQLLAQMGLPVGLARHRVRLGVSRGLRTFALGDMTCISLDDRAFQVSDSVIGVMGHLEANPTLEALTHTLHLAYGGSRDRITETLLVLLDALIRHGLVQVTLDPAPAEADRHPVRPADLPIRVDSGFAPSVTYVGSTIQWLTVLYATWLSWVDYLSHRDDLAGALSARQDGAAANAARALAADLMSLRVGGQRNRGSARLLAELRADLRVESRAFRDLMDLATTRPTESDVRGLGEKVDALEEELVGALRAQIGGDLVTDQGHRTLFQYVRQILDARRVCDARFTVAQWVVDKSERYGCATGPTAQEMAP
jgi:hypothetical protein